MPMHIRKGNVEDGGFILEGDIHISQRELEALAAIAKGNDNESAAKKLDISYTTFRNHTYNIMRKLQAKNRTQALVKAIENGMIVIDLKTGVRSIDANDYYVCMYCARAFTGDEVRYETQEPFTVNHVRYEPPDQPLCAYEDCRGYPGDAFFWYKVREYHPEYPEIPEKGVVYDTSELEEAKFKQLELERKEYMKERELERKEWMKGRENE